MARFASQPEGLGPISPISLSLVASRHPVCVSPRFANWKKLAPSAARAKVNDRLWGRIEIMAFATFAKRVLEVMFFVGLVGSAIVVLISFWEDGKELFGKD